MRVIELNPGPRNNNTSYNFSFCHWNLNPPTPQNGQTHSNNLSAVVTNELFEYVWPFCWVGTEKVNSIVAHNFSKMDLLEAYNIQLQQKFDMFCLSEPSLDSSITTNDERLNMKGFELMRADNPSNSVC